MTETTAETQSEPPIRYWTAGTTGEAVLLVMGFGMRGEVWRPQIDGLSKKHRVAWFDHRGLGLSQSGSDSIWWMKDMAQDAFHVLDSLGWDRCHLVGVSMGGMIAQEMVVKHPHRFKSLSLLVTHPGGHFGSQWPGFSGFQAFMRAFLSRGPKRIAALEKLLYPSEFLAKTDRRELHKRMRLRLSRPAPKSTLLAQLAAVMRHDTRHRLKTMSVPTLILKAGSDILVPPTCSDHLKSLIPKATLFNLEDAGHGLIFQKAELVNDLLASHFHRNTT
ncbi:MAG: alpha/beta fold hydrolase [Myxococcota bacterium]|nr:alpha/beta fold hydrolase [Myxococcota bacterium]